MIMKHYLMPYYRFIHNYINVFWSFSFYLLITTKAKKMFKLCEYIIISEDGNCKIKFGFFSAKIKEKSK